MLLVRMQPSRFGLMLPSWEIRCGGRRADAHGKSFSRMEISGQRPFASPRAYSGGKRSGWFAHDDRPCVPYTWASGYCEIFRDFELHLFTGFLAPGETAGKL